MEKVQKLCDILQGLSRPNLYSITEYYMTLVSAINKWIGKKSNKFELKLKSFYCWYKDNNLPFMLIKILHLIVLIQIHWKWRSVPRDAEIWFN